MHLHTDTYPADALHDSSTVVGKCGILSDLSGVLVFYPGADIRVQREVWSKVLKIFCREQKQEQVSKSRDDFLLQMFSTEFSH